MGKPQSLGKVGYGNGGGAEQLGQILRRGGSEVVFYGRNKNGTCG